MSQQFKNKTVLVTGAGSGIGRETALQFSREGAKVVVSDVVEAGGLETVRLLQDNDGEALFVKADVSQSGEVQKLVQEAVTRYGKLDIAVNNAGVASAEARVADYPEEEWQRLLNVNLTGVFLCLKYEIQQMLEQGGGTIVNVASIAGLAGYPKHPAYSASKHGVIGLTRTAAIEYVRQGIRINAVCPGYTDTPMVEAGIQQQPELAGQIERRLPIGRIGTPAEIARGILYLCSDGAAFMVGHTLVLDGGITAL